eukprot:6361870-Prymnesium_polylepis.1
MHYRGQLNGTAVSTAVRWNNGRDLTEWRKMLTERTKKLPPIFLIFKPTLPPPDEDGEEVFEDEGEGEEIGVPQSSREEDEALEKARNAVYDLLMSEIRPSQRSKDRTALQRLKGNGATLDVRIAAQWQDALARGLLNKGGRYSRMRVRLLYEEPGESGAELPFSGVKAWSVDEPAFAEHSTEPEWFGRPQPHADTLKQVFPGWDFERN